jgi:hypothetical protein
MKRTYTVSFCMLDFKEGQLAIHTIFDVVARIKAAIFSQSCVLKDWSFSDEPDREMNPDGAIATLSFDVLSPDDYERSLVVESFVRGSDLSGVPPRVFPMVSFQRKEPRAVRSSCSVA